MKKKLLIYYVDDDEEDLEFVSEIARNEGHTIATFISGEAMLSMLDYVYPAPDVIFLDYLMPTMNGIDVLKTVKSNHILQHIPAIMVTGLCSIKEIDLFLKAGANHVVEKARSEVEYQEIFRNVAQINWDTYCPVARDFIYF